MNRRSFLAAPAVAAVPSLAMQPVTGKAKVEFKIRRLNLKHTWTTVMSSSDHRGTFYVEYTRDGVTGIGEGAPIVRYHESAETCRAAAERIRPFLETMNPWAYSKDLREVLAKIDGEWAAKAAIDIAILDWVCRRLKLPLYRFFGLERGDAPITTFSIGIDKADVIRQKVKEAAAFPVLKIKVGLDNDEEVIGAVRSVTDKPLRVDANEGFKSKEDAVKKILWLEKQNVELIEQPVPASQLADMQWIRERVNIPIVADEAVLRPEDVIKVAPYVDGVNVKVDKCGGLQQARLMINIARALGLKVMLGCMVSSSCAITAAAELSPLVDWADLDGNLLISNDPYVGVLVENGRLILPDAPGLGLKPNLA